MDDKDCVRKAHRKRHAGPKAEKNPRKLDQDDRQQRNPKAFSFHSVNKVSRAVRRTLDVKEKKHHIPTVERTSVEPPPVLVAVVGPPKVGKTTLINCLIRNFTRQKLSNIQGPVTVVSGKKRRLTLIECSSDINCMIDIAKTADLVLLLVDASFGFEMEIFEFLNICQVHGFPKIMGVLTHLDLFPDNKQLRKVKKKLKHRFWMEVYQGAKLFFLSGMVNGEYQKTEVHNLGRFISVMKFRQLQWRSSHPYVLADRMEDVTDGEKVRQNSKCDRSVCLYGYVRGTHFRNKGKIHIPGCGDYSIHDMSQLADPCPLPNSDKKRALNERERQLYAPLSGVGGIVYDKDAVYIDLGGSHHHHKKKATEKKPEASNGLLSSMIYSKKTVDNKMASSQLKLFTEAQPIVSNDPSGSLQWTGDCSSSPDGRVRRKVVGHNDGDEEDSGGVDEEEEDSGQEENDELSFADSDSDLEDSDDDSEDDKDVVDTGQLLKRPKLLDSSNPNIQMSANSRDCSKFGLHNEDMNLEEMIDSIRDCFVTGEWKEAEDAETLLNDEDELFGDFEDLEDGQKYSGKDADDADSVDEDEEDKEKDKDENAEIYMKETAAEKRQKKVQKKRLEKKRRLKAMFDQEYDEQGGVEGEKKTYFDEWKEEMHHQGQLNRTEFEKLDEAERAELEGFRPGLYVRIQVNDMPCEFVHHFNPAYPVILGGLLSAEQNIGFVQVRLKKHRWHKRILKTQDPLIVSLGWRRFQTIAVYSSQDHNGRQRLLKYTPEHLHCNATFWGPITPQGAGVLAMKTISSNTPEFRLSATGVVTELDKSVHIVKKLKLTGQPFKIYKKTAFIQGMFKSSLEVAKFEGSIIRTVSGLRGQIKRAVKKGPDGAFRATFEDKILLSDLVFVSTWYPVQVTEFYNVVSNLLLPASEKDQWQGLRTVGQLRKEQGIQREVNQDHLYKEVTRQEKTFHSLQIPRDLQRQLPFKDKLKLSEKNPCDSSQITKTGVIRDAKEKKIAQMMKMLKQLHGHKMKQRRQQMRQRAAEHQKKQAVIDNRLEQKHKEVKKHAYRVLGKIEKRQKQKKQE